MVFQRHLLNGQLLKQGTSWLCGHNSDYRCWQVWPCGSVACLPGVPISVCVISTFSCADTHTSWCLVRVCSPNFILKFLQLSFKYAGKSGEMLGGYDRSLTVQSCRSAFWSQWGLAGSPWNQAFVGRSLALTSFPMESSPLDSSRYNYLCVSTIPNRHCTISVWWINEKKNEWKSENNLCLGNNHCVMKKQLVEIYWIFWIACMWVKDIYPLSINQFIHLKIFRERPHISSRW